MSAFFSYQHAIRKSKLEPTTKLVLYTIATYMALDGTGCFPSYATIAESCGLGRSTAIAHVKKAVEAGFLTKLVRHDEDGEHTSNLYQAMMPQGSPLAGPPSPDAGPRVVQQRDPKYPTDLPKQYPPKAPKGPCGWEEDSGFMSVMEAYQKLNPSRVNPAKAWAVWREHSLSGCAEQILAALPTFAAHHQWKKEGGQFIPNFAKWLADGAWRTTKVALQVNAEELEERRKIHNAGMSALARVEYCRRVGKEPEAADIEAVRRWHAQQVA
ncbi:hypothetical protein J2766_001063 [Agrobacterium tumefaciens]|uniref:Helix-turn-helix domain-containing protein n=1 Tax=Agrobacterium tumefaciens TaxID=358 RepID=A0AAW8LSN9_AGRTU|nr:helix-turn-helix domain-containing protein [Agrobacterium tumefaciens]MBP2564504.1 hypothetical protein [Agrobacterium tumefaciens]MDR6701631.1 hypothetical protein [Agrobacterium tumefaciens]